MRRVSFLVPDGPLTPERVSARLAEAGIKRHPSSLEQLTDLELVLIADYVERLFMAGGNGKVMARPRPAVLDMAVWGPRTITTSASS